MAEALDEQRKMTEDYLYALNDSKKVMHDIENNQTTKSKSREEQRSQKQEMGR